MNRRHFISNAMRAAVTGSLVAAGPPLLTDQMSRSPMKTASSHVFQSSGHDLNRHRFGVNYTPTKELVVLLE